MVKISDFQMKDIVNLADGKKMGSLHDLDIDTETGQIIALIVSGSGRWPALFQRESEIVIPWTKIKKIGADIIFVDFSERMPLKTIQEEAAEKNR